MKNIIANASETVKIYFSYDATFKIESGAIVWDTSLTYTHKFIILDDNVIVIAPIRDHHDLRRWYDGVTQQREHILEFFGLPPETKRSGNYSVIGAGNISKNGEITNWESRGLGVETPQHLRQMIEQEVQRMFQAGEIKK